jgi:hypothetical protein
VVVVTGEVLGELEAGVLVARHDPAHDPGPLEDGQVAVGRAEGEVGVRALQLGHRHRPGGAGERVDEDAASGGVALLVALEPARRGGVEVLVPGHGAQATAR